MSLIKLAGKLPKEVAKRFHELVSTGMEKGHAARKAWGEIRQANITPTPVVKTVAKVVKKADNGIQGQLFDPEEFSSIFKRRKK